MYDLNLGKSLWRVLLVLVCLGLTACLEVKDDEKVVDDGGCTFCHELGAGTAHETHIATEGRTYGDPMVCEDCHEFPTEWFDEDGQHLNANLDIEMSDAGMAATGGLVPEYDGASCQNVYCHGASLNGGSLVEPKWNSPPEDGIVCGMCHGVPPGDGHPDVTTCNTCHSDSYTDDVLNGNHLDGTLTFAVTGGSGAVQ